MDWHGDWVRDGMWLLWIALALGIVYTAIARRGEWRRKRKERNASPPEDRG